MRPSPTVCVCLLAVVAAGLLDPVLAGALEDVSIVSDRDSRRATVYKLINRGERSVRTTVELTIECNGIPAERGPTEREYWVDAGRSVELGKTRPGSNCERFYSIVDASYP